MSNATAELRSALSALCTIVECSLTRLPSGTISPELFRQAKNDDKNATGPLTALLDAMVMESLQLSNIKQAVELLCIAPPSDWKSSAALLTVCISVHQNDPIVMLYRVDICPVTSSAQLRRRTVSVCFTNVGNLTYRCNRRHRNPQRPRPRA